MGEDANGNEIVTNNPGSGFGYTNDYGNPYNKFGMPISNFGYDIDPSASTPTNNFGNFNSDYDFNKSYGNMPSFDLDSIMKDINAEIDTDLTSQNAARATLMNTNPQIEQKTPGMTGFEMGQLGLAGLNSAAGLYQYFDTGRDTAREKLTGIKMQNEDNRAKIDAWKRHDASMRRSGLRD